MINKLNYGKVNGDFEELHALKGFKVLAVGNGIERNILLWKYCKTEGLLHDCGKRMDIIFAVTLSLFSVWINSPEGKQIEEGLQMFRGYIFQFPFCQWVFLDISDCSEVILHSTIAERTCF